MSVLALLTAAHKGQTTKIVHFTIPRGSERRAARPDSDGSQFAVEVNVA